MGYLMEGLRAPGVVEGRGRKSRKARRVESSSAAAAEGNSWLGDSDEWIWIEFDRQSGHILIAGRGLRREVTGREECYPWELRGGWAEVVAL